MSFERFGEVGRGGLLRFEDLVGSEFFLILCFYWFRCVIGC